MAVCEAILVAEDNSDDACLLEQAFLKAGLTAPLRFVCDGQEAIEYLEDRPPFNDRVTYPLPNLILVDLKMPRLNGYDLLEWIRYQPSSSRMVVGVLSGISDPAAVERSYRSGAKFHISKPNRFEDLVSIARFLIHVSGPESNDATSVAPHLEVLAAILKTPTILPSLLAPFARPGH